jgi:hypothetical protein
MLRSKRFWYWLDLDEGGIFLREFFGQYPVKL